MDFSELIAKIGCKYEPLQVNLKTTVLLLIDMQNAIWGDYFVKLAVEQGIDPVEAKSAVREYDIRVKAAADKAAALLNLCREKGIRPIHVRIQSLSGDGADTGIFHKRDGVIHLPGDYWSQWMEEAKPLEDEIVLSKTCSGAVIGTMLDTVLRNLQANEIIVVGFYTDQCVETTVRDLADCGYTVSLVMDATATETVEKWEKTKLSLENVYCRCQNAEELMEGIRALS